MTRKDFYQAALDAEATFAEVDRDVQKLLSSNQTKAALGLKYQRDLAQNVRQLANLIFLESSQDGAKSKQPPTGPALRASREYAEQFIRALKMGFTAAGAMGGDLPKGYELLVNVLTETGGLSEGSEGGFITPLYFDLQVYQKAQQYLDLAEWVTVSDVTSVKGKRVYELTAPEDPLAAHAEVDDTDEETDSPTFVKIDYKLAEYASFLPVSRDLFSDTPINILDYLSSWYARKIALRNNSLIIPILEGLTPTPVTDYTELDKAIKTALNKTLDPMISAGSAIFTNQSGFDVLDQLKDGTGRPLLEPSPNQTTPMQLHNRPVVMLADRLWPAAYGIADVAVGSGKELCVLFRRGSYEMARTDVGGDAWRSFGSEVRGIYRADIQLVDESAMVLLEVTLPA